MSTSVRGWGVGGGKGGGGGRGKGKGGANRPPSLGVPRGPLRSVAEDQPLEMPPQGDPVRLALAEINAKIRPGEVVLIAYGFVDREACNYLPGLVEEEFGVKKPYYMDCWWSIPPQCDTYQ